MKRSKYLFLFGIVIFFAFIPKENEIKVFELVDMFNKNQETLSQIHIAVLKIEKSN